jgi:hypothetical protein
MTPAPSPLFDLGRLRLGEVVAALGAVIVLLSLWLDWYVPAGEPARTGWQAFGLLDVLIAVAIVTALALPIAVAARRSLAVPVALSVTVTVLGTLATILVAYRLVNPPGRNESVDLAAGAWIGLAGIAILALGGWMAMRREAPGPSVRRREAQRRIAERPAPPPASTASGPADEAPRAT